MGPILSLVAVTPVADGLLDFYSVPIRVQFVGNYEWQGRAACRTHLRAMGHDPNGAVGINSEINARVQRGVIRVGIVWKFIAGRWPGVIAHAKHQCSHGDDASRQKSAPADVFNPVHAISPAADLIAARIRW